MTVKSTVSFTDRHHQFAQKKVKDGVFASVSSLVAAGIEQVMRDEEEREIALEAMKETIKQRAQLPDHQWTEMNENDDLFESAQLRIENYNK